MILSNLENVEQFTELFKFQNDVAIYWILFKSGPIKRNTTLYNIQGDGFYQTSSGQCSSKWQSDCRSCSLTDVKLTYAKVIILSNKE